MKKFLLAVLIVLITGSIQAVFSQDNVPRMTKEELQPQLANPDFVIIDVRTEKDWEGSKVKIKGAVREEARKLGSWITKYPKEKTLVFY
jgi:hypothetical protein